MSPIMLVTADKELARVVKAALRDTSARVTIEAASPRAAAEAFAQQFVSLVVVDLFLPESSGLDVLKMLKRANDKCLFILLTRIRTRTLIERAFRMGAQDVLHYPVSTEDLRDTILHRLEAQPLAEVEEPSTQTQKPARK